MNMPTVPLRGTSLVATCLLFMVSPILSAQDTPEPTMGSIRPTVFSAAQVPMPGRTHNDVTVFLEEGAQDYTPTTHLFYDPLIVFVEDDDGDLKREINTDGRLTLWVLWDTDRTASKEAIREHLSDAKHGMGIPKKNLPSLGYIRLLRVANAWFETPEYLRSDLIEDRQFVARNEVAIHFQTGSRLEAQRLANQLNHGSELVFRYRMEGVADDLCEASVSAEQIHSIGRIRDLIGDGGHGFVSRQQVVDLNSEVGRKLEVEARCHTSALAHELINKALTNLGAPQSYDVSRSEFEKFSEIAVSDFVADITTHVNNTEQIKEHHEIKDILTKTWDDALKYESEADLVDLFSANFSAALQDKGSRHEEAFSKIVRDAHLSDIWDGTKHVPKAVALYRVEDLIDFWRDGVTIKFTQVADVAGIYSKVLRPVDQKVRSSRLIVPPTVEEQLSRIRTDVQDIRLQIDTLGEEQVSRIGTDVQDIRLQLDALEEEQIRRGVERILAPVGAIVAFFGKDVDIPKGWVLCDGRNNPHNSLITADADPSKSGIQLPDLRGRFIRGSESGLDGVRLHSGGHDEHDLRHSHLWASYRGNQWYTFLEDRWEQITEWSNGRGNAGSDHFSLESHVGRIDVRTDTSQARFDNRPKYSDLRYIIRIH